MTQRDRQILVVLFGGLASAAVVAFLGFQWFLVPLRDQTIAIAKLTKEVEDKEELKWIIERDQRLLERWRHQGLPSNPNKAASEYLKYLQSLFKSSGLKVDEIHTASTDIKTPSTSSKDKGSAHIPLAFTVRAKGSLASVVTLFESFQATPLLHRVKSFTLDRGTKSASPKQGGASVLAIHMTIEALIVNRAEKRPENLLGPDVRQVALNSLATLRGGPSGLALLPWQYTLGAEQPKRRYADIARKNVFVGAPPPPPVVKAPKDETPPDTVDVLEYVRLMYTTQAQSEAGKVKNQALLRNFLADPNSVFGYTKLNSDAKSGYAGFQIWNDSRTKVLVKGKVLRIDPADVYFQVRDEAYAIHVGQTLEEALRRPLGQSAVDSLKLVLDPFDPGTEPGGAKTSKTKKGKK